jgi:hypothetical protein
VRGAAGDSEQGGAGVGEEGVRGEEGGARGGGIVEEENGRVRSYLAGM